MALFHFQQLDVSIFYFVGSFSIVESKHKRGRRGQRDVQNKFHASIILFSKRMALFLIFDALLSLVTFHGEICWGHSRCNGCPTPINL